MYDHEDFKLREQEDVKTLKNNVLALNNRTDEEIEYLYRKYSHDSYSAGWLILDASSTSGFSRWFDRMKQVFRP